MLRIAVCDDIPADLKSARTMLEEYCAVRPAYEVIVSCFDSPCRLLTEFECGRWHDVYLLDILMPGFSGIQLGRTLRRRNEECSIIFGTVAPEYALESYDLSAQSYLLKPFGREALFRALDQAVFRLKDSSTRARGISVLSGEGVHFLPYRNILYMENAHRAVVFHLTDGRQIVSMKLRCKFEEALADPLTDPRFCQPHKSYVVNMDHIRFQGSRHLELVGGATVPMADGRKRSAQEQYLDYIAAKRQAGRSTDPLQT